MSIWPFVATHTLVGSCAWLNGYTTGAYLTRRSRDEIAFWGALQPDLGLVDLTDRRPYDWVRDGECVPRGVR